MKKSFETKLSKLVFKLLPVFLQNVAVTIEGMRLKRKRYGGDFNELLNKVENQKLYTSGELTNHTIQNVKFKLAQAAECSHYSRYFDESYEETPLKFLEKFPILSKQDVQKNGPQLTRPEVNHHIALQTSGSSGTPLKVEFDEAAYKTEYAYFWSRNRPHVSLNDKNITFNAREIVPFNEKRVFWRRNFAANQILFSQYHLTEQNIKAYVDRINSFKPRYIQGYPSVITLFCSLAQKAGLFVDEIPYIFTGSETLHDYQRSLIEQTFKGKIFDLYGQVEKACLITQCREGRYHINEDYSYVELMPLGGDEYEIIATPYLNNRQIFMRYRTGDSVIYNANDSCTCGQNGRIVRKIIGRMDDYLVTSDNRKIGRLDQVVKYVEGLQMLQIHNSCPGVFEIIVRGRERQQTFENVKLELLRIDPKAKITLKNDDFVTRAGKCPLVLKI